MDAALPLAFTHGPGAGRPGSQTWDGQGLEGAGVTPDVDVELSREVLAEGTDDQLLRALEELRPK